jgi:GNAT superfamily N-acetyltransferase
VELIPYGADDAGLVEAAVTIERAIILADSPWERPPTTYRRTMTLRHGDDGEVGRHFLLRQDGDDVGLVAIYASDYDNPELAWVWISVHPERRRQGLGTAALELVLDECRDAGRPSVLLWGWESEASRGFASSAGFAEKGQEIRRVQELDGTAAERDRFAALHAQAGVHASDYELLRLAGAAPEHLLPALAQVTAVIKDAPLDEVEMEDERYDAARVSAYEQAQLASGFRFRRVVALHRETGAIAGHTVVVADSEQPAWGEQHDTAVVPAHRGHRLGLLLKTEMLLWLHDEEPQLRRVLTENMESNGPMVAVNELLGQRVCGRQLLFQRRV